MMRKTLLIVVMCLTVMLSLFAAECAADGDELEPGAVYYSDIKSQYSISFYDSDNHCTIGGKNGLSGAVFIPSKVIVRYGDGVSSVQNGDPPKTYTLTEVGSFQNNKNITSITISDGVQKISGSAFLNCTGLTGDLTIPDSVISLGSQAFRGCTGLNGSLHLGSGITKIEGSVFFNCGFTGQLVIPNNVTEIQSYAFQECKGFTGSLIIPATVMSIGYDAFKGCTGFNGTLYLNCTAATATRSGRTFSGCTGFTGLQIADGITSITNEEFYNCKGMTGALTIPNSVTSISSSAFYGCSGFTGTLTIPSGVTVINDSAFRNCSGLTGLTLPAEVTTIKSSAFEGCTGMTGTLLLPNTLETVESSAFYQCGFTGNLTLPEGMTTIGGASFGCPGITGTLTIPSSLASMSGNPFSGMFDIQKIVNNSTKEFTLRYNFIADDDNDTFFVKEGTAEHLQKYIYVSGNKKNRTFGQGTYLRNGEDVIVKTDPSTNDFVITPPTDLGYTGTAKEVTATVKDGITGMGAVTIKYYRNGTQVNSAIERGEYTFKLNVAEGTRYYAGTLEDPNWKFTIVKGTPTVTAPMAISPLLHTGNPLALVTAGSTTGGTLSYAVTTEATAPETSVYSDAIPTGIETGTYYIWYKVTGDDNYLDVDPQSVICRIVNYAGTWGNNITWTLTEVDGDGFLEISGQGAMNNFSHSSTDAWLKHKDNILSVQINEGITSISVYAFHDLSNMTGITLPDSLTSLGNGAFWRCSALADIALPKNLTNIGNSAFYFCTSLTEIAIPENVTSICGLTFFNCTSLTGITLPEDLTTIGTMAFNGCSSLIDLTLPEKLTTIGSSAFCACSSLKSIEIPAGITAIEDMTFTDCTSLESISLPEGLTSIGVNAFTACSSLSDISLPESLTDIDGYAFSRCNALTTITLPKNLSDLGSGAFAGCNNLTAINLDEGNTAFHSVNRILYSTDEKTLILYPGGLATDIVSVPADVTRIGDFAFAGCTAMTGITLPTDLTGIGSSAFVDCSGLTGITIPVGVTEIGTYAFNDCSALTSIILPEGITTISDYAFQSCTALESIAFPESLTVIGDSAFYNCQNLTVITIPVGVTSIGSYAFSSSQKLRDIWYGGTQEQWNAITIGNYNDPLSKATIHYSSVIRFDANGGIGAPGTRTVIMNQEIVLPETMPTRADWFFLGWGTTQDAMAAAYLPGDSFTPTESTTFYAVWGQPDLVAPEDLMTIEEQAFAGSAFNFAALSAKTTAVQANAFAGCPNLVAVYIPAATMQINAQAFGEDRQSLPKLVLLGPANGAAQTFAQTYGFGFIPVATSAE